MSAPSLANDSSSNPSKASPVSSISERRFSTIPAISLAWLVVGGEGGSGGGCAWPAFRFLLLCLVFALEGLPWINFTCIVNLPVTVKIDVDLMPLPGYNKYYIYDEIKDTQIYQEYT